MTDHEPAAAAAPAAPAQPRHSSPPPHFATLPTELHVELARFLPVQDRIHLSQTCAALQPVYRALAWRAVYVDARMLQDHRHHPVTDFWIWSICAQHRRDHPHLRFVPLYALRAPRRFAWVRSQAITAAVSWDDAATRAAVARNPELWPALNVVKNYHSVGAANATCAVVLTHRDFHAKVEEEGENDTTETPEKDSEKKSEAPKETRQYRHYEMVSREHFLELCNDKYAFREPLDAILSVELEFNCSNWEKMESLFDQLPRLSNLRSVSLRLECDPTLHFNKVVSMFLYLTEVSHTYPDFRPETFRVIIINAGLQQRSHRRTSSSSLLHAVPIVTSLSLLRGKLNLVDIPFTFPNVNFVELDKMGSVPADILDSLLPPPPLHTRAVSCAATLTTVHFQIENFLANNNTLPLRELHALKRIVLTVADKDLLGLDPAYYSEQLTPFVRKFAVEPDLRKVDLQPLYKFMVASADLGEMPTCLEMMCFLRTMRLPTPSTQCPLWRRVVAQQMEADHEPLYEHIAKRMRYETLFHEIYEAVACAPATVEYLCVKLYAALPVPFWLYRLVVQLGREGVKESDIEMSPTPALKQLLLYLPGKEKYLDTIPPYAHRHDGVEDFLPLDPSTLEVCYDFAREKIHRRVQEDREDVESKDLDPSSTVRDAVRDAVRNAPVGCPLRDVYCQDYMMKFRISPFRVEEVYREDFEGWI